MKLYFKAGSCSLSPHIVLLEAGLPFELVEVDLATKLTKDGADFRAINPKGSVPALELDDGQVLTEGAVIVQYLADRKPAAGLAPVAGTLERYRLQEWLNYIASEIHKNFSPLFNPKAPDDWKTVVKDVVLAQRFAFLASHLDGNAYLMGDAFSIADAYLFTVLTWTKRVNLDLGQWPALAAFFERVAARPTVRAAMTAEGLI